MPTLNIKDPEVYRLAADVARRRGISMTAAVREALAEALSRSEVDAEERVARILAISRRASSIDAPVLTDDDLYDGRGMPR